MTDWNNLHREIWYWAEQGRTATFWWRDDDAIAPDAKLDHLLAVAAETTTPVALAVIAGVADPLLAERIAPAREVSVVQHGFAHANHAPEGQPQDEYGPERTVAERLAELAEGRQRMMRLPRFVPVLVPPWNRLPHDLLAHLPAIGLQGVSAWGPRPCSQPAPGVRQVNVHVDLMDWNTRRFCGHERGLGQMINHLRARRLGTVDTSEPTGLMTHHAFHGPGGWAFLVELLRQTRPRPGIRWLSAGEAFAQPPP